MCIFFYLLKHLTSNSLINLNQSAYSKHNSTETKLFSLHDHLSNDISRRHFILFYILSAIFALK